MVWKQKLQSQVKDWAIFRIKLKAVFVVFLIKMRPKPVHTNKHSIHYVNTIKFSRAIGLSLILSTHLLFYHFINLC